MPWWTIAAIALMVVSAVIQVVLTPKQKSSAPKASGLDDFNFPQWDEGTPQPVVFGDCWCPDWTVLWYGDLEVIDIKKKVGGKK